jgi:hypothetical protein
VEFNYIYAIDNPTLCLTEHGTVIIDRVDPVWPTGGLRVKTFATRPAKNEAHPGYEPKRGQSLADVGYPVGHVQVVKAKCAKTIDAAKELGATLLGIEPVKPSDASASTDGFLVR